MIHSMTHNIFTYIRRALLIMPLCLGSLFFSACKGPAAPQYDQQLLLLDDVACVVGSRHMVDFSSGIVQSEYNPTQRRYRAGVGVHEKDETSGYLVEVVKEYFVLELKEDMPEEGQSVGGQVILRTNALNREYKDATFKVLKRTDSMAWLWDDATKLGVIVRIGK